MIDIMWELLDKLSLSTLKKYVRKTTHLVETTVVSAKLYLPKCSYLAY
jgi:hypothetical protein